jgi:type IV secretion system protein VirB10
LYKLFFLLFLTAFAAGQTPAEPAKPAAATELLIPAGTKVPVSLKHAISTKSAREGDAVYTETTFPIVMNDRVLIPANTFIQGRITAVKRPGRIKGRAELQIHFTTMIYPSGYTVVLPGAIDNVPGADKTNMKGEEGTIQQQGEKGRDLGTAASAGSTGALTGAVVGGLSSGGSKGALIGAASGGVLGVAIALLSKGNDVRLESGTTLEMVIQRPISVDASRVPNTTRPFISN